MEVVEAVWLSTERNHLVGVAIMEKAMVEVAMAAAEDSQVVYLLTCSPPPKIWQNKRYDACSNCSVAFSAQ